eukprot:CAMPEP_0197197142 /NCGR_PEP_ID=MMETSP1423-20130617/32716_1 /TAXON_ID=476441 /ORGANISM="Pseudo-nitzschia heimii, Strain UNC1101" /LENGTH=543 /DNA_ID=CAMNT_0042650959 /DNA_START=57 /DNA_END=1688 /DNA_ORIENTATION=+
MELCSGDSPKSRRNMCKNTDQTIGITVPLPSILPPIEKWYVVARKPSSGTCSIYSSWSDYQAESKSSQTRFPNAAKSAGREKSVIEDVEEKELAAFPIMAQALTYIKAIGSNSRPSHQIESSFPPTNQRDIKANKHVSDPKKRIYRSALKTIEVIGEDGNCNINNGDDKMSKLNDNSSPSPVPSGTPLKKRKIETGMHQPDVVILKKHLSMSKTSKTIDIGSHMQEKPDTSSLDALATAASANTDKKKSESKQAQQCRVQTINSDDSSIESENSAAVGARLPAPVILPRGVIHATRQSGTFLPSISQLPENILGRLPSRLSPSLIADYNKARNCVERQKRQQKIIEHRDEKQYELQQHRGERSLESKIVIPEVPTTRTSSLKIPEVPRGFVPEELRSERMNQLYSSHLQSRMDARGKNSSQSMASAQTHPLLGFPNRLSLESYPLGQLPRQIQGLPQHLQGIPPTSVFQPIPQLLSLQLQSSQNLLNHQSRNNSSAYAQHLRQQQLQAIEVASTASGASDGDRSEITIQRRNGRAFRDSTPRG